MPDRLPPCPVCGKRTHGTPPMPTADLSAVKKSAIECKHGALARNCEVCELQAENARLADNRRFWMETANSRSAEIIRLAARVAELEGDYERGLNDSTRPLAVGNAKLAARVKKLESAINKHRDALIESGLTAEDARENKKHFDELESTR